MASYDQQRRCVHAGQGRSCQIWPATARNDCGNTLRSLRRRSEGGPASGAGAKVADTERTRIGILGEPIRGVHKPIGKEWDIEAQMGRPEIDLLLFGRQQVHQQS